MFSVLTDITPRDCHNLFYTSPRNPNPSPPYLTLPTDASDPASLLPNPRGRYGATQIIERSLLGRLRDEERTHERRKANVGNLGHTWLKPPGLSKTLFQMREERREAEEHAEAMRREVLAQELAEAEAAGGNMEGVVAGDEVMAEEGERDLDEDIPDADEGGFGFDGVSEEERSEDEDEESEEEDGEEEEEGDMTRQLRRVQQREMANRVASMRATEDRMREMMARGGNGGVGSGNLYGGDEDIDEEDQAEMLEEEDLVSTVYPEEMEPDMSMGMDADLDGDIPEAESGVYEHTDSEAELSSEDDTGHNISYGGMRAPHLPHPRSSIPGPSAPRSSMGGGYMQRSSMGAHGPRTSLGGGHSLRNSMRGDQGPRSSLDISSILSRDGSSIIGSSPRLRRGN